MEFREAAYGRGGELVLPSGRSIPVARLDQGECTVLASRGRDDENLVLVFVDGELSFTIEEYVKILSPLSRTFAVSESGYIAYQSGEHRENVFNLRTWDGGVVLQRIVEVALTPSFTPDEGYVGFYRLTDRNVYIYDVENARRYGIFDPTKLRDPLINIGVEGVRKNGNSVFEIKDTYGKGEDDVIGYISPNGEIIESEV